MKGKSDVNMSKLFKIVNKKETEKLDVSKWVYEEDRKFLNKLILKSLSRTIQLVKLRGERKLSKVSIDEIIGINYLVKERLFYLLKVKLEIYQKGFSRPIQRLVGYFSSRQNNFMKLFTLEDYRVLKDLVVAKRLFTKKEVEEFIMEKLITYGLFLDLEKLMSKTFFKKGWRVVPKKYISLFKDELFKEMYKGGEL